MTREEKIEKQALSDEDGYVENNYYAFKRGVEWADKNPKRYSQGELCDIQEEMMKQRDRRLIEKACKWLSKHISAEDIYDDETNEISN